MVQYGSRIFVAFAAVSGVAVEAEAVVEALLFALGLCDELGAEFFEGIELTVVDGEVRDDGAAGILGGHGMLVVGCSWLLLMIGMKLAVIWLIGHRDCFTESYTMRQESVCLCFCFCLFFF